MADRMVGLATAGGLATVAAVHGAWAMGATWPRESPDELADLVVGHRPFPSPLACNVVTAALSAAALAVAIETGLPVPLRSRARTLTRSASAVTAGALLLRGALGIVASTTQAQRATEEFRRNDLRFYSPLCLVLGTGAAIVARGPR